MIPKVIHYCWLSDDQVPPDLKFYMKSWEKMLSGYEFVKWDFNRFDKSSSSWVSDAFDNKKYAFACDYIRLYAIYNYGGIYMDMDIEVLKSFDDLIEKEYFFGYEGEPKNGIEAGIFGAEKGNEFIGKCLDYYKGRKFVKKDGSFDQKTLPLIMQAVMDENEFEYEIYDNKTFTAKSFSTGEEFPEEKTYTIHHFAGSWITEEEKKLIAEEQRLSQKYGLLIGRNLAQYNEKIRNEGLSGALKITMDKIARRIGGGYSDITYFPTECGAFAMNICWEV